MTPEQIDRLLDILARAVSVAERWADTEYPVPNDSQESPEIYRVGAERDAQTPEEYAKIEPPGRFEQAFKSAKGV